MVLIDSQYYCGLFTLSKARVKSSDALQLTRSFRLLFNNRLVAFHLDRRSSACMITAQLHQTVFCLLNETSISSKKGWCNMPLLLN